MPYRDMWVECQQCGKRFVFTVEKQRQMARQGLEPIPSLCSECLQKTELDPGPHEGVVKWYDPDKGYGFIARPSGKEIFFHRSGIMPGIAIDRLPEGARVTFLVEQSPKGPQAVEVAPMEES